MYHISGLMGPLYHKDDLWLKSMSSENSTFSLLKHFFNEWVDHMIQWKNLQSSIHPFKFLLYHFLDILHWYLSLYYNRYLAGDV